jgi:hypothetical protein
MRRRSSSFAQCHFVPGVEDTHPACVRGRQGVGEYVFFSCSPFLFYKHSILNYAVNDVPFVSRLIVQSLLPGCPSDLVEEGRMLSAKIQPLLKEAKPISTTATSSPSTLPTTEVTTATGGKGTEQPLVPSEAEIMMQLIELCPACGVEVPLENITSAVCRNGHTWGAFFYHLCILLLTPPATSPFSEVLDNHIHTPHTMGPFLCWVY